jgi:hypothetical protein
MCRIDGEASLTATVGGSGERQNALAELPVGSGMFWRGPVLLRRVARPLAIAQIFNTRSPCRRPTWSTGREKECSGARQTVASAVWRSSLGAAW